MIGISDSGDIQLFRHTVVSSPLCDLPAADRGRGGPGDKRVTSSYVYILNPSPIINSVTAICQTSL